VPPHIEEILSRSEISTPSSTRSSYVGKTVLDANASSQVSAALGRLLLGAELDEKWLCAMNAQAARRRHRAALA